MDDNGIKYCPEMIKMDVKWNSNIKEVIKETIDVKELFIFFLDHPIGSSDRFFWTSYKSGGLKIISISHKANNWNLRISFRLDKELAPTLDAISARAEGDTNDEELYVDWLEYDLFYMERIEDGT